MNTLRILLISGPNAKHAMTFMPGGSRMMTQGEQFEGPARDIPAAAGC